MNWETLNTSKIKTVYYSEYNSEIDFGTRIKYKCHQFIQRIDKTLDSESCTNWKFIDSLGVRLDIDNTIYHNDSYKHFYDDFSEFALGHEL